MLARNKIAIVLVGLGIAGVSAYAIGTSDAVVTRVLRTLLGKYVRAPCRFDSASFTFLHGLDVQGLTVLDPADPLGAPLLAAERAHVDYVLDVLGSGPRVKSADIERPRLRLERAADGTLPIVKAFFFPPSEGAAPKPSVHLSGGVMTFWDPAILAQEPLELRDIEIQVTPAAAKSADWARATIHLTAASDVLGPVTADAVVGDDGTSATFTLRLPRTRLDPHLPRRFTGEIQRMIADLAPSGELSVEIKARAEPGRYLDAEAAVEIHDAAFRITLPESAAGRAAPKPVDVTHVGGHLRFAAGRIESHDLVLGAFGAEFRVDATIEDVTGPEPALDATVTVRALTVTRELRAHLPLVAQRIAEAYDIMALVDATASVRGKLPSPVVTVDATVTDGHVRYDGYVREDGKRRGFPWDADGVRGRVRFDGSTLHLEGLTGTHGPASVHASGKVTEGATIPDITILVEDAPLDDDVRRAFTDRAETIFDRWGPSGVAKAVTVHIHRVRTDDGPRDATDVTVECDGRAGFRPQLLPVQLSKATGRVEVLEPVVDGRLDSLVRLTDVTAQADGFTVAVSGEERGDGATAREDLLVTVDTDDAGGSFRAAALDAPESTISLGVKSTIRKLGASGPVGVIAHLVRNADQTRNDQVKVVLRGTSVTGWDDIRLPANGLTGTALVDGETLTFEDIAGFFALGGFSPAFKGHGRLLGLSGTPQFDIHVEATQIPLGDSLQAALGPLADPAKEFWARVRPVGTARADLVLDIRPDADPTPFEIDLSHINGGLQPLGLELDNADGTLHYDGRRATLSLDSAIGGAAVRIDHAERDMATGRVTVLGSVRGLRFPEDLEGPLSPETVAKIADWAPGRALHASDFVIRYEPESSSLEIAGMLSVKPRARRPLPDPGYAPDGNLEFSRLVFWMPESAPMYFQGEVRAEDFALRAGLAFDQLSGPFLMSGTLGQDERLDLSTAGASLRVEGYPLNRAVAKVAVTGRGVRVDVKAKFFDGDLDGWIAPGKDDVDWHGEFHLAALDLEKFLRFRGDPQGNVATGRIDAKVRLQKLKGPNNRLRGDGKVVAYDGRLLQTPGVGDVLSRATLGLYTPVLTDGELKFDLDGDWLDVKDLTVSGSGVNASIVGGEGKIGLVDGRLDMAVYPRVDLGVPIIDQIWHLIQAPLPRRVRLTGTLRNPKTNWEPVSTGETDRRREPQPAGDVAGPQRDPW